MTRFSIRRALVLATLATATAAPAWAQADKPLPESVQQVLHGPVTTPAGNQIRQ